jgi:hypothetical protein
MTVVMNWEEMFDPWPGSKTSIIFMNETTTTRDFYSFFDSVELFLCNLAGTPRKKPRNREKSQKVDQSLTVLWMEQILTRHLFKKNYRVAKSRRNHYGYFSSMTSRGIFFSFSLNRMNVLLGS